MQKKKKKFPEYSNSTAVSSEKHQKPSKINKEVTIRIWEFTLGEKRGSLKKGLERTCKVTVWQRGMGLMAQTRSGKSICQGHGKTETSPPHFLRIPSDTVMSAVRAWAQEAMGMPGSSLQQKRQQPPSKPTEEEQSEGPSFKFWNGLNRHSLCQELWEDQYFFFTPLFPGWLLVNIAW